MKHHIIIIRSFHSDDTPAPSAETVAALCEAVLRVPGLRVKSVEVAGLTTEPQVATRRIREVKAKRKGEALQVATALPHLFRGNAQNAFCIACGKEATHPIHA